MSIEERSPRSIARKLRRVLAGLISPEFRRDFLYRSKRVMQNDVKRNFHVGASPDGASWAPLKRSRFNGSTAPLIKTGTLWRSVYGGTSNSVEEVTDHTATIGVQGLPYAGIHQRGGTIVPKNAKYLTIPLTKEAEKVGGARNFPRPLTFIKKAGSQSASLAERSGKRGTLVFQYSLVKSATIPARPYLGFGSRLRNSLHDLFVRTSARFRGQP